ncbi:MAG: TrkH family potassium uptake protein [Clostridia bacterium]
MARSKRRRLSSTQIIISFYIISVLISSVLLWLPVFHNPGVTLSYIDALFTASSAISVTGLSVITIHEVFNKWGILLLTLMFQVGGIGVMTLGTFFWLLFRQKIGLEQRKWIATDHNRSTLAGLVELMRNILILAIVIELAGTILIGSYLLWQGYETNWYTAYYNGFFAAVSAFTNAGFDIYGNSLLDFSHDYVLQTLNMLLIICGAIGFPVLIELQHFFANRRTTPRFTFSLFTKVTTFTFFVLLLAGALFFFLFERDAFLLDKSWHASLFYSLFQSVSARSAGLTTLDISLLSPPTLVLMSVLMFIGASPSSVGGGIRTTTLFVLFATIISYMRGHRHVRVFGRELADDDIYRSQLVFFFAISLVFIAVMLLTWIEQLPVEQILFEVCSAFGTTGMSTGITSDLSGTGKMILITMMVIGRIGVINMLLFLKRDDRITHYRYPKERIIIGQ